MQLRYLETLKEVGTAPSMKIVVPMELGGLLGGILAQLPSLGNGKGELGSGAEAAKP
jgi:hypothetical protein